MKIIQVYGTPILPAFRDKLTQDLKLGGVELVRSDDDSPSWADCFTWHCPSAPMHTIKVREMLSLWTEKQSKERGLFGQYKPFVYIASALCFDQAGFITKEKQRKDREKEAVEFLQSMSGAECVVWERWGLRKRKGASMSFEDFSFSSYMRESLKEEDILSALRGRDFSQLLEVSDTDSIVKDHFPGFHHFLSSNV